MPESEASELSSDERLRYARHLSLPQVGVEGQLALKRGRVLLVGLGGLGSPAALYLAAAGVGRLTLVDPDRVETSNLQRQILFGTSDVGRLKVEAARDRLLDLNPELEIEIRAERFTATNAQAFVAESDLVLDGSDNFPTRYLTSDAGVWAKKPVVHGSIYRFEGQCTVFAPHLGGPCYRCLFPTPPQPNFSLEKVRPWWVGSCIWT